MSQSTEIGSPANEISISAPPAPMEIALLTGGGDRHYAVGMALALASRGINVDYLGSDENDGPELHANSRLYFRNLRPLGGKRATVIGKITNILRMYAALVRYAWTAKPKIFHILWNNKIEYFDRTVLMGYYKALGKKVTLTAHNVNAGTRDANDSALNRMTLKFQYRLCDHIFVHTGKMKQELQRDFAVVSEKVSIIPYGINNAVPTTSLTPAEARQRLGLGTQEKTILFFGNIAPYKGLEYLVRAFETISTSSDEYRLIVAGRTKKGCERYVENISAMLNQPSLRDRSVARIEYIPDEDIEIYFKAADLTVLPYTCIFQSGVLFLGYSFGIPTIVSDVGELEKDVVEGKTGYIVKSKDPEDLARKIEQYFRSDLYLDLGNRREEIRQYIERQHSWSDVAEIAGTVFNRLPAS
jgi:glycosyltransferase involved in cell wall biosynthesis